VLITLGKLQRMAKGLMRCSLWRVRNVAQVHILKSKNLVFVRLLSKCTSTPSFRISDAFATWPRSAAPASAHAGKSLLIVLFFLFFFPYKYAQEAGKEKKG
jgi:hypothetical protein